MNSCARPPAICPGAAVLTQDSTREEGIAILDKVVSCVFQRSDRTDALIRDLTEDLCYKGHLRFSRMGEGPRCT